MDGGVCGVPPDGQTCEDQRPDAVSTPPGKAVRSTLLCFSEKCPWKLREKGPVREESSKIEPRWKRGISLGFLRKTNEYEIWDPEAEDIFTARCGLRLVRGKRFCAEALTGVAKTPHDGRVAQHAPPVFQDIPAVPPPEVKPGRAARGFDIYKKVVGSGLAETPHRVDSWNPS